MLSLFLFDRFQFFHNYCIQLCTSVNKIDICEAISGLFLRGLLGLVVCGVTGALLTPGLHFSEVCLKWEGCFVLFCFNF